jgi:hypothetical protein
MAERHAGDGIRQIGVTMNRRGILAAAEAVVAGIAAKQAAQPVLALSPPLEGDSTSTATPGVTGFNNAGGGVGVYALSTGVTGLGAGVYAQCDSSSDTAAAVFGLAFSNRGQTFGVYGTTNSQTVHASGIYGTTGGGTTNGVFGEYSFTTATGTGVFGLASDTSATGRTVGVWGLSQSRADGAVGTLGETNAVSGAGIGVLARTTSPAGIAVQATGGTYGVYATASNLHGVCAECGTTQGAGALVGVTKYPTGVAFQAVCQNGATNAGYFVGNVSVQGALGVTGAKYAVVKGSDGQYRGMYAMEAPEPWFEDVGQAKLTTGRVDVKLDPLFAQYVQTDDYHVFITEHDENNSLHVTNRTTNGFTVRADDATLKAKGKDVTSVNGTFSWRVVAKRGDIAGERLPVWQMPSAGTYPAPPETPQRDRVTPSAPKGAPAAPVPLAAPPPRAATQAPAGNSQVGAPSAIPPAPRSRP